MLSKYQYELLEEFADLNDRLFDLGVTTTDSFTGEIAEYVACHHFKLKKSERVTKAVDGVDEDGFKYQVKSKLISSANYFINLKNLPASEFDYLVIVFLDGSFLPARMLRVPAKLIQNGCFSMSQSVHPTIDLYDQHEIKLPAKTRKAIIDFAIVYHKLEQNGITRSKRVVGDIGEFYACRKLGLKICANQNEKGYDARHSNGQTFEIKTRRVYQSGRRLSETRRLNNLSGKSADWLVVVVLDRCFKCAGMWLMPMSNIVNPGSAKLDIVNKTPGDYFTRTDQLFHCKLTIPVFEELLAC